MKCHICNATLSPAEINHNTDHNDWDPCTACLDVISEVFNDRTEKEIDDELLYEFFGEVQPEGDEDGNEHRVHES